MNNKVILYAEWQHAAAAGNDPMSMRPAPFMLQQCPADPKLGKEVTTASFGISETAQALLREGVDNNRKLDIFVLFLSAYGMLFSRYMDMDDIPVYTPLLQPQSEEMAGLEVPLLLRIDREANIRTQISLVSDAILGTYILTHEVPPETDKPHEKLSNVLFTMDGLHDTLTPAQLSQFDVVIRIQAPPEGRWTVQVEYNKALFLPGFMDRMNMHLHLVFEQFRHLGTLVRSLKILTEEEQELLLKTFNQTAMELPAGETVVSRFMAQAAALPLQTALVSETGRLTYEELDRESSRLALHLAKAMQVKQGMHVGVMLERSAQSVIALLAVLKAGGVYVPIDPSLPQERIVYMLIDAGIKHLLTASRFIFRVEQFSGDIYAIDVQQPDPVADDALTQLPLPDDPAYIIYTSGSTGQPKGVLLQHEGLLNTALDHIQELGMQPKDKYLQFMSVAFDGSLLDIFTTLLSGATLVVPAAAAINDAEKFLRLLEEEQVSLFTVTPSYLSALNRAPMHTVHTIISAGEPVIREDALHYAKSRRFYNGYGPSEITVNATLYRVDPSAGESGIPIGRPAANKRIYIVDRHMQLLAPGFTGEICIGGAGVALGYLHDESMTASRFVSDPFGGTGRLYRTGDNGRWLPDGNIMFMGRRDEQLKVNGYRIDPGEITTLLLAYPGIADARAFVSGDGPSGNILTACYTLKDRDNNDLVEVPALRLYLSGKLPHYMLPSLVLEVPFFPVTANGKLDKARLMGMTAAGRAVQPVLTEPLTPEEQILAAIWCEVLGRSAVSKEDDFFHLGGDSIKSIQIISRLLKAGYKLDVKQLFDKPVLADAAQLMVPVAHFADQSMVTGEVPFTPIQQEVFLADDADRHHYNQAMMLFARDGFDPDHALQVFEKIMEHHDALRIVLDSSSGTLRMVNRDTSLRPDIRFHEPAPGTDATAFIEDAAAQLQTSIDLENGPLMKVAVFHTSNGDYLLLVIHHLVVDSISMRILLEDIEKLFEQCRNGQTLQLPPKTDSFKKWAEDLAAYANTRLLLKERNYWAGLSADDVPVIKRDMSGKPDNMPEDAERISFALDLENTSMLITGGYRVFNTDMNDILLAALMMALKETFGLDSAYIALEGHGREEILENVNITRTVGWFTTTYPLLLHIPAEDNIAASIAAVKEQRKKVPNNGIGYGILKYLTPPESKHGFVFDHQPQIGFNYLGQFDTDIENTSFTVPSVKLGEEQSRKRRRLHDLEIRGQVANKHLQLSVEFNTTHFRSETMLTLSRQYETMLKHMAGYCQSQDLDRLSPADLTYKNLSIDDLDSIFS